ncbi:leucine-rich repeat-containing protein 15-like [Stegodyphus dumicola]|uniref:leucine-rich repeat-containing protein 15-like n=1 Tax=Stegodyphus dumicola TaxID=202533 RepID=UPI0015B2E87F|nr:leucine-rich repeat-containing protein 15-like [Stegodyphus dumicola]
MPSMQVTYFFALFLALASCEPKACPDLEDVAPCTCKRSAYGLHAICANFNSSSHLVKAFRIIRNYRISRVLLHGLYIPDILPNEVFYGMHIKELNIRNSKLKFLQPAFTGLENTLHTLSLKNSTITSNNGFALARLTKLENLNIRSFHLIKVRDTLVSENVPNIQFLTLDENNIKEIENHAFSRLSHLKAISLASNQIGTVQRSMFPHPAMHLTKIDLSMNLIEQLPPDIFVDMPSLKEIILNGNKLQTLSETTWKSVWENLQFVFLIGKYLFANSLTLY